MVLSLSRDFSLVSVHAEIHTYTHTHTEVEDTMLINVRKIHIHSTNSSRHHSTARPLGYCVVLFWRQLVQNNGSAEYCEEERTVVFRTVWILLLKSFLK